MKSVIHCSVLVFTLSALGQTASQIPEQLTLATALDMAIKNSPALQVARTAIEIAEAERLDASKKLNPAFSLNFEDYRLFSGDPGAFFQTQEITARVDQELETAGKRRLRTGVADWRVESEKASHENAVRALRLEVRRAYLKGVLAQTNLELAQTVLQEIDRIIALNQVRFENGDISGSELKRIEVERLRFVEDVFAARLALADARSALVTAIGLPEANNQFTFAEALLLDSKTPVAQEGIPPILPLTELERQGLARRPDLTSAAVEERRADTETLLQRAIRSPNITIGAGYKRNLNENSVAFGLTIPLKIFNRNEGGIARAMAERERAAQLATQTKNQILLDIRKAYNAVEINRERLAYVEKESIRKADEARQILTAAYRLGGTDLINLLDSERAFRETRRLYHQALYDYRISLYELGSAIGLEVQ